MYCQSGASGEVNSEAALVSAANFSLLLIRSFANEAYFEFKSGREYAGAS